MFFARFRQTLHFWSRSLRTELAMDLGTANTLVYRKGSGIVLDEPSVVALESRTGLRVALGAEAKSYLGRTPDHIRAVRPLKDGVIADFDAATAMVNGFLERVHKPRFWINPKIIIGVPSGITPVEKRALKEAAYMAGARYIYLMEEPMAAAIGGGLNIYRPRGNMIVDIGGGTTEIAVITLASTAYSESIRIAGDQMDDAVLKYVYKNLHVELTPAQAEEVKIRIGCASADDMDRRITVTGKEVGRGGPRTIEIHSSQVAEALEETVDTILDTIRRALEQVSPALLSDIKDRGILLTGGGALLTGLDKLIQKMTGIETRVAENPLTSVVMGCAIALEDPELHMGSYLSKN